MTKNKFGIFLMGIILTISMLTNPNESRQKEILKYKLNVHLQKILSENDVENQGFMFLGNLFVSGIVNNAISTDNYIVFSTTNYTYKGESKVIGLAAFGNVFLFNDLDDLKKQLN